MELVFDTIIARLVETLVTTPTVKVVILGDLLHTHNKIEMDHLHQANRFIERIISHVGASRLILLIGNHDRVSNHGIDYDVHAFRGWKSADVVVVDRPMIVDDALFLPYLEDGSFIQTIDTHLRSVQRGLMEMSMVVAHQSVRGVQLTKNTKYSGNDTWQQDWPILISGHIHHQQDIGNIHYPGSPFQHDFSDQSEKKFVALLHEGKYSLVELVGIPRLVELTISEEDIPATLATINPINRYKIHVRSNDSNIFLRYGIVSSKDIQWMFTAVAMSLSQGTINEETTSKSVTESMLLALREKSLPHFEMLKQLCMFIY